MIATRILRWVCDPAKLEAIEGDLAELYDGRPSWRYLVDIASVCLRQPRTVIRTFAAAAVLLVLTGRQGPPIHYTIHATDPAGRFTLEFHKERVIAATLDDAPVHPERVVQTGNVLVLKGADGGRDFHIAITPRGGIEWEARRP